MNTINIVKIYYVRLIERFELLENNQIVQNGYADDFNGVFFGDFRVVFNCELDQNSVRLGFGKIENMSNEVPTIDTIRYRNVYITRVEITRALLPHEKVLTDKNSKIFQSHFHSSADVHNTLRLATFLFLKLPIIKKKIYMLYSIELVEFVFNIKWL